MPQEWWEYQAKIDWNEVFLHQHAFTRIESHYYADGGCHKHSILPFFIDLITLYGILFRWNMNYGAQLKEEVEKTMNRFMQFDEDEYHDVRKDEQASSTA